MTTYSFPGAIGDVPPTPNKVESTWGNALRDLVVNQFANDTDRDAAITAPVEGMTCYVAGDHALETYAGSTDGWRAPWNLPWGAVPGGVLKPADVTGFTSTSLTDLSGMTATFDVPANRNIEIEARCNNLLSTVDGDVIEMTIHTPAGDVVAGRGLANTTSSAGVTAHVAVSTLSGTGINVKARARRVSGSGTIHFGDLVFIVKDIGPAGAPS